MDAARAATPHAALAAERPVGDGWVPELDRGLLMAKSGIRCMSCGTFVTGWPDLGNVMLVEPPPQGMMLGPCPEGRKLWFYPDASLPVTDHEHMVPWGSNICDYCGVNVFDPVPVAPIEPDPGPEQPGEPVG